MAYNTPLPPIPGAYGPPGGGSYEPPPTRKSHILLYAIVGIVIIGIGVGVYLYLKSKKTTKGTTGTSGSTGLTGTTGTTGTTGLTGTGTTGPCNNTAITSGPLFPEWFLRTGATSTATSYTITFDTSNIPANVFPLTFKADVILYAGYDSAGNLCPTKVDFPSAGIPITPQTFNLTINHNSTYAVDSSLFTTDCTIGELPDCGTNVWQAIFINARLVNQCGAPGPAGDAAIVGIATLGGGVCFNIDGFPFAVTFVTLPGLSVT
jgi:hypothetical protein